MARRRIENEVESTGQCTLVPAVPGKRIIVTGIRLYLPKVSSYPDVQVYFGSLRYTPTVELTNVFGGQNVSNPALTLGYNPDGWMATLPGESLIVYGINTQYEGYTLGGGITYQLDD